MRLRTQELDFMCQLQARSGRLAMNLLMLLLALLSTTARSANEYQNDRKWEGPEQGLNAWYSSIERFAIGRQTATINCLGLSIDQCLHTTEGWARGGPEMYVRYEIKETSPRSQLLILYSRKSLFAGSVED